uniref:Telomeric repeat-binding factor 2-interacting protein 1 n=1 Tax=Astyanax mexicanus TaxID=7994 RepID=W5K9C2_ASTMX
MAAFKKESSDPSPVLFLNTKGEPMRFFIRPGPTKMQLQPLIQDCGGVVCRTQEPNAILLAEPGEVSAATDGAGQFYISTQYIRDCVTQNQQLDMKTYRLSSQINPAIQTRSASRKQRGSGRMGYSLEDDTAILDFITHRRQEAKGNRVWQEMERKLVTSHSWQSMKYRYLKHLQFKQTNKSPEKRKKSLNFKESFSSEENTIQKLELEPEQNSASPLRPDLEGEIQPCAQSDGNETEVSGDKPDLGSSHEEEKHSQRQPVPQDFLQAKEHVVKLMQDCKKDLMEVMKALLKASGDVTLARWYLLNGYKAEVHGPIWTRHDDEVLLSAGSSELDQLREKFGEDRVLKRAEFLKAR